MEGRRLRHLTLQRRRQAIRTVLEPKADSHFGFGLRAPEIVERARRLFRRAELPAQIARGPASMLRTVSAVT